MTDELSARLREIGTATAGGILHKLGVDLVFPEGLHALNPSDKVAGPVRTVRFIPHREDKEPFPRGKLNRDVIDELNPGEILVIDGLGALGAAITGDNHAMRAHLRGAAAIVIDGAARDAEGIRRIGLPMYVKSFHPRPHSDIIWPWEKDVPVQCGGVRVDPGDYIIADADGVLVVPKALAQDVAAQGHDKSLEEQFSTQMLRGGATLEQSYPLPEARRGDFENFKKERAGNARA